MEDICASHKQYYERNTEKCKEASKKVYREKKKSPLNRLTAKIQRR